MLRFDVRGSGSSSSSEEEGGGRDESEPEPEPLLLLLLLLLLEDLGHGGSRGRVSCFLLRAAALRCLRVRIELAPTLTSLYGVAA